MTVEMTKYIKSTQGHVLNDESDLKSILAKDAIYNAAGLVSFNLYDEVRAIKYFSFNRFGFVTFDQCPRLTSMNGSRINSSMRSKFEEIVSG